MELRVTRLGNLELVCWMARLLLAAIFTACLAASGSGPSSTQNRPPSDLEELLWAAAHREGSEALTQQDQLRALVCAQFPRVPG